MQSTIVHDQVNTIKWDTCCSLTTGFGIEDFCSDEYVKQLGVDLMLHGMSVGSSLGGTDREQRLTR